MPPTSDHLHAFTTRWRIGFVLNLFLVHSYTRVGYLIIQSACVEDKTDSEPETY